MSEADRYKGGSFPGQEPFFVDGDQSLPEPIGMPRISFPLEGDSKNSKATAAHVLSDAGGYQTITPFTANFSNKDCFIIEQDFKVAGDWFDPLPLNTAYDISFASDYRGALPLSEAILVSESPLIDIGNGFVKWTRTYVYMNFSVVVGAPATFYPAFVWNDYESIPFTFAGFAADPGAGTPGTEPFPDEVEARVERIFFVFDGINLPTKFFSFFPYLTAYGPAFPSDNVISADTSPTLTEYQSWIADLDEIVVRPSILRRWKGNIYELVTYYAVAQ